MVSAAELQHLVKTDFKKNFTALFTGTGLALLVNIAALPILSRLYTPMEFGEFALYVAIIQILVVLITGNFDYAILQPKKNGDALEVAAGGAVFALYMSILVSIAIYFAHGRLLLLFASPIYGGLVWLLPIVGFLLSVRHLLVMWGTRRRRYSEISKGKVFHAIALNGVRLPRSLYAGGGAGLWMGFLVSELMALFWGVVNVLKNDKALLKTVSVEGAKQSVLKYVNYPVLSMPLSLLNTMVANLLVFVLAFGFSAGLVGLYDRFTKLVGIPMDAVSSFLGTIFYQRSQNGSSIRKFFLQIYVLALILGVLLYLPILFYGPSIFAFILGGSWTFGGVLAQYLAPLAILSFVTKSISPLFLRDNQSGFMLIWQLTYLLVSVGWIIIFYDHSLIFIVKTYAALGCLLHLLLGLYLFFTLKKDGA